jgi:hypothetical protein
VLGNDNWDMRIEGNKVKRSNFITGLVLEEHAIDSGEIMQAKLRMIVAQTFAGIEERLDEKRSIFAASCI